MKKLIVFFVMVCCATVSWSQIDVTKAASSAGFDVKQVGESIMSGLTSKIGLSTAQVSTVAPLVTQFLTNKSSFMSLAQTKPAEYKTKLEAEQKTLFDKMKGSLKADQFTKFMSLKPKAADATNALSQLFF